MAEPLSVGGQLGSYLIESVIGRGGMSTVYRAVHTRLGTAVALKVLAPELSTDDRFRERFLREAKMAAGIDHPNVVPIYDTGIHDDSLYMVMRFVAAQRAADAGRPGPRRPRARRRPRPRARPPRRQAGQHPHPARRQRRDR